MAEWWQALTGIEQIFYVIAITSTVILFLQLILNLIGLAGHDVDVDVGHMDVDVPDGVDIEHPDLAQHSSGLGLISYRTITAFFVGFGWSGVVMLRSDAHFGIAIPVAVFVGFFFVLVVFYLMREIYKLSETGNIDLHNAIGQVGTVYIPIPPKGQGQGQVQVKVQSRLRELSAVTNGDEELPARAPVKVVKLIGKSTLVVEKLEAE
jgi:hypothetical protein